MPTLRRCIVIILALLIAFAAQSARAQRLVKAEVKPLNGLPTLYVHGRPLGPMGFRGGGEPELMKKITATGIKLYLVWWRMQPVEQGFAGLDRVMASMLERAPEAYFFLVVRFVPTAEFARAHPDETVRFNDGASDHFVSPVPKLRPEGVARFSFASEIWRGEAERSLRALIRHVRRSSYDDRIAGYFVGAGHCGEWIWWCDFNHGRYDLDYSAAMTRAFRKYLAEKYGGDVAALRRAWNDPKAAFEDATVPPLGDRNAPAIGDFYDPSESGRVRDYAECHSAVVSDSLLQLARAAKEADDGRSVVGAFFGSLQCVNYLWSGQSDYMRVFESPDVDFMASPFTYENRGVGDHAPLRALLGSLRLRGKLWFAEADDRTCFSEPNQRCYGAPDNLPDTLAVLWRDFAHILAAGVNGWWTCFGPKWFDDPEILQAFKRMQQISQESLSWDCRPNGEIAVLIHRGSLLTCSSKLSFLCLDRERIHEWGRLGSMPEYFDLSDVSSPEVQRHKLFIFPNSFSLTSDERRLIDRHLKRDGNVLVWIYAPGVINPGANPPWSVEHMRDLVGMRLACDRRRLPADMILADSDHPAVSGLPKGMRFGSFTRPITSGAGITPDKPVKLGPVAVAPRFYVDDPSATALGRYAGTDRVGFAIKKFPGWTSVYLGSPAAPAVLLRALARFAGVHLYLDGDDVVYHNRTILAIHTARGGKRSVRLPGRRDVFDLIGSKSVARDVVSFDVEIPARRTVLYQLKNR